ncbi:hypothetical protein FJW08_09525 [Mesorhizobium sp. B3-2-1]|nr:hypothetical protein FJW08_09525 [Mesorhizobium sp. B3-2-1]
MVAYATFGEIGICHYLVNGCGKNYFCGRLAHLPEQFQQKCSAVLRPELRKKREHWRRCVFAGNASARSDHERS